MRAGARAPLPNSISPLRNCAPRKRCWPTDFHASRSGACNFAVFHAVRAQLYAEGFEPRTHRGAQHLFNLHFVRTGRFEPAASGLIARLQKFREEADYAPAFVVDDEGAREDLEAARGFVARIRALLSAQG